MAQQKELEIFCVIFQGVLRQVPLFGSLLNWWSPPPKDSVKGRTFSLNSGMKPPFDYHYSSSPKPSAVLVLILYIPYMYKTFYQ